MRKHDWFPVEIAGLFKMLPSIAFCENMLAGWTEKLIRQTGYYCTLPSSFRFQLAVYFQKNLSRVVEMLQCGVQEALSPLSSTNFDLQFSYDMMIPDLIIAHWQKYDDPDGKVKWAIRQERRSVCSEYIFRVCSKIQRAPCFLTVRLGTQWV